MNFLYLLFCVLILCYCLVAVSRQAWATTQCQHQSSTLIGRTDLFLTAYCAEGKWEELEIRNE